MRLVLWKSPKGYEDALAPALQAGAAAHGDEIVLKSMAEYRGPEHDGALLIGVVKREILWDHQRAGRLAIYLDKGFIRQRAAWHGLNMPAWWRVCINAVHPTAYLMNVSRPADRAAPFGRMFPRQTGGRTILIAGSSEKYHHTMGLPHPTEWTRRIVADIRRWTDAPIVYRPKPSWQAAVPIEGTTFDHGRKTGMAEALARAKCVVTYGSIASVDAIMAGVPCITLGNAPAWAVSGHSLSRVDDPYWPSDAERAQWLANLSFSHFRPDEIETGLAWGIIKEQINAVRAL